MTYDKAKRIRMLILTAGSNIITYIEWLCIHAFMSNNMLTTEESQHKDEIINLTEQVLDAKGIECDERISKLSEEKLREILEEVRKLRNRRKKRKEDNLTQEQGKEMLYVR